MLFIENTSNQILWANQLVYMTTYGLFQLQVFLFTGIYFIRPINNGEERMD